MGELYQLVVALMFMGWNLYLTLGRTTLVKDIDGLTERVEALEGFRLQAATSFVTHEALKDLEQRIDKRFDKLESLLEKRLGP